MVSLINSRFAAPFLAEKKQRFNQLFLQTPVADNREFNELYKVHYRQIFNLCFHVTKNEEISEVITVKVFVQFYREMKSSEIGIESAAIYLRRLAVRSLLNHVHASV